jgi:hypothetical protein
MMSLPGPEMAIEIINESAHGPAKDDRSRWLSPRRSIALELLDHRGAR